MKVNQSIHGTPKPIHMIKLNIRHRFAAAADAPCPLPATPSRHCSACSSSLYPVSVTAAADCPYSVPAMVYRI